MVARIKLFDPYIDKSEEKAILSVLKSHFWAAGGNSPQVEKFEKNFAKYVNTKNCISVNSGTAALHLALSLFNLKNREVILPSLSFVSTAHAVLYNKAIPIFADIELDTLCISPKEIKEKISKKTSIILPVHFGGMPCKMDEILNISKNYKLKVVEDAAHAVGSKYAKNKIGSHGDVVCFSFHPVKNLAMPNGGAITLNNKNQIQSIEKLKARRWCGISNRNGVNYDVNELGWNFYMNEFSAVIGIEQLKKLNLTTSKRKKTAKRYTKEIKISEKMKFSNNGSYHLYWILVKNRKEFREKMLNVGIETGTHYKPIHQMKLYKSKIKLPITDYVAKKIVTIPIHPNLNNNQITSIIKNINKFAE